MVVTRRLPYALKPSWMSVIVFMLERPRYQHENCTPLRSLPDVGVRHIYTVPCCCFSDFKAAVGRRTHTNVFSLYRSPWQSFQMFNSSKAKMHHKTTGHFPVNRHVSRRAPFYGESHHTGCHSQADDSPVHTQVITRYTQDCAVVVVSLIYFYLDICCCECISTTHFM